MRELEYWGALFDRTKEGGINQRAFGGHTWKRLAHVGDRTGLEMIRTLQEKGIHSGIDVYMECTITHLVKDGDRVVGAFGLLEREREVRSFPRKLHSSGDGRGGKGLQVHLQFLGIHRRRPRDGV